MEVTYKVSFCFIVTVFWTVEASIKDIFESLSSEKNDDLLLNLKRQAIPNDIPFKDNKGLLIYFREVLLTVQHKAAKNVMYFKGATATTEYLTRYKTILTLEFPPSKNSILVDQFNLELTFELGKMGYYKITNLTATLKGKDSQSFDFTEVRLSSNVELIVPKDNSFHCSRYGSLYPLEYLPERNHTFSIDIKGFQVQAFIPADKANELKFVKAYECVGFFTPAIWMGIILAHVLIFILILGVKIIMEISK